MAVVTRWLERALRGAVSAADAAMNRLYGSRYNPIYQSGTLAVALLAVLIATGLYLLLFYRIGAPYQSVAWITAHPWLGRWVRGLHRYASDATVVAVAAHAVRMFAQRRRWGPRALAWVSGLGLLGLILVCGWTGYVMVWDVFGQMLAVEGARVMDLVPIFAEPLGRAFVGERPIPGAFFFLNLFLHIAIPIGLGIVLWLHVSRVARPTLLPPRAVTWAVVALLTLAAVVLPVGMAPEASAFRLPDVVPLDAFYAFWLPVTRRLSAGTVWLAGGTVTLLVLLVPVWARPAAAESPPPSIVDERLCTGCTQCSLDCPYEAIAMVPRTDGRADLVARVDPALCVSCGICAGSCAPMGVGPPGRNGRDQLAAARQFVEKRTPGPDTVVVIACTRSAVGAASSLDSTGSRLMPVTCAGNLHTSVIEFLLRTGAGGVMVVACPPRDCWNREGSTWLEQRMYNDREAELQARVDRRRVALVFAGPGQQAGASAALHDLRARIREMGWTDDDSAGAVELECDTVAEREGAS